MRKEKVQVKQKQEVLILLHLSHPAHLPPPRPLQEAVTAASELGRSVQGVQCVSPLRTPPAPSPLLLAKPPQLLLLRPDVFAPLASRSAPTPPCAL